MPFVYIHVVAFACWMLFVESDPWPRLTLIVSLEAIFLSTFVIAGQGLRPVRLDGGSRRQQCGIPHLGWRRPRWGRCSPDRRSVAGHAETVAAASAAHSAQGQEYRNDHTDQPPPPAGATPGRTPNPEPRRFETWRRVERSAGIA
jgi:hypothetical protein